MGASQYVSCCSGHHSHVQLAGNINDPDRVIEQIEKLNSQEFSEELFRVAHETITKSIGDVYGEVKYGNQNYGLMNDLKRDAYRFAAFKAANFSHTMKGASAQEKDQLLRAFEVQLETENNTATRAARSAKQWQEFEAASDQYPNLEYLESRSADKRDEHKKYYGLILPINHSFWSGGLPPNDYGCKCRARQTDKEATEGEVDQVVLPKGIVGNAGKERKVFANNHSFYTNLNKTGRKSVMDHYATLGRSIPYPKKPAYKSKGMVNVHDLHDKADITENFESAKVLAKNGVNVNIRPHMIKDGFKNPEFEINGGLSDLKINTGKNVSSGIKDAARKNCETIVIKIDVSSPFESALELSNKVKGNMAHYSRFKGFYIIDKQQKLTYWPIARKATTK